MRRSRTPQALRVTLFLTAAAVSCSARADMAAPPGAPDAALEPADEPAPDEQTARQAPSTLSDAPVDATAHAGAHEAEQSAAESSAEPPDALRLEAQLEAVLALPFPGQNGGAAYGFGISYAVGWGSIPLLFGLDFMSIERSHSSSAPSSPQAGAAVVTTTSTWGDRQLHFEAWLRAQPPRWAIRPYLEGFAGATLLQTRYVSMVGSEPARSGADHDWVSAFGFGAGVDFMGLFDPEASYSFTVGLRWRKGGHAHIDRPVSASNDTHQQRVATDAIILAAGMCGRFDFGPREVQR